MSDVSIKELIEAKFDAVHQRFDSLEDKIRLDNEYDSKRRHAQDAVITAHKAATEAHFEKIEATVGRIDAFQKKNLTRLIIWLSVLSLLTVLSLIGLSSQAGSLLGIIVNAF